MFRDELDAFDIDDIHFTAATQQLSGSGNSEIAIRLSMYES